MEERNRRDSGRRRKGTKVISTYRGASRCVEGAKADVEMPSPIDIPEALDRFYRSSERARERAARSRRKRKRESIEENALKKSS